MVAKDGRASLIHVVDKRKGGNAARQSRFGELTSLAFTAGAEGVDTIIQLRDQQQAPTERNS